jgi:hypothetical protein
VRLQFVSYGIGWQLRYHGVDQLAEGRAVRVKIGLGLGDLLAVLSGLAKGVVDEESDVLTP